MPFSEPKEIAMTVSPEKMRLRSISRCNGLVKSFTPICRQESRISSSPSTSSSFSPAVDDDLQRAAVGQQAIAVAVALGQADLVEQRVGFRGGAGEIGRAHVCTPGPNAPIGC